MAEGVVARLSEFTPAELVRVLQAYGDMRRQYYDSKLWNMWVGL